jgi:GTP cyclohydrolase I
MNIQDVDRLIAVGDAHSGSSLKTPIRADAFDISDGEKIERIAHHFEAIMQTLGLDLTDDSLSGTPYRVAKMYVQEVFSGLNPANKPKIALFENKYGYDRMIVERNITLQSMCEHHFVPIIGKAHVAYFGNEHVIGLSKLNRIVKYYAQRPQVQERLTLEIAECLADTLGTEDVAVIVDAKHYCVSMRGVEDTASSTVTSVLRGRFEQPDIKDELLRYIQLG